MPGATPARDGAVHMSIFDPSPILLAYIFVQRFVFFEVLGLLALLRVIVGRGAARLPAAVTLAICVAVIAASLAPALGLQGHPFYRQMASIMAYQGGGALPLFASALFATSLLLGDRRWRWIDGAHLIGLLAFVLLWIATKF